MIETLANLRTRIQQRCDLEHDGEAFITADELDQLINKSYRELYALLVKAGLHSVPESKATITATGAAFYGLPDAYYSIVDVYRVEGGGLLRLKRHNSRTRPVAGYTYPASTYRVYGIGESARIEFDSRPGSGTYEVYYIPLPEELENDNDEIEGVLGWEEYIVADVSIDVKTKQDLDTRPLLLKKAEMAARIQEETQLRDMHESVHIADVRDFDPYDAEGTVVGGIPYRGQLL